MYSIFCCMNATLYFAFLAHPSIDPFVCPLVIHLILRRFRAVLPHAPAQVIRYPPTWVLLPIRIRLEQPCTWSGELLPYSLTGAYLTGHQGQQVLPCFLGHKPHWDTKMDKIRHMTEYPLAYLCFKL